MRAALDTKRLTDLFQGDRSLAHWLGSGVLLPGSERAEHYARLFVQLKRAGTPIPDNDLWIAALALEHDLILITMDRHFQHIPQLLCG